jgi:hypothetical protein
MVLIGETFNELDLGDQTVVGYLLIDRIIDESMEGVIPLHTRACPHISTAYHNDKEHLWARGLTFHPT